MSKKAKIIIIVISSILALLIIAGIGVWHYIKNTPEYALYMTVQDIKKYGAKDGLEMHLTDDAWDKIEPVVDFADKKFGKGDKNKDDDDDDDDDDKKSSKAESMASFLKKLATNEIDDIDFSYKVLEKHKTRARIQVFYESEGKYKGSFKFSMVKEDGKWLIDDVKSPELNKFIVTYGVKGINAIKDWVTG